MSYFFCGIHMELKIWVFILFWPIQYLLKVASQKHHGLVFLWVLFVLQLFPNVAITSILVQNKMIAAISSLINSNKVITELASYIIIHPSTADISNVCNSLSDFAFRPRVGLEQNNAKNVWLQGTDGRTKNQEF